MDLRQLASHYYDLAARVLELFEEEEIVDVLSEVRTLTHVTQEGERLRGPTGADMGMGKSFGADLRWGDIDVQGKSS